MVWIGTIDTKIVSSTTFLFIISKGRTEVRGKSVRYGATRCIRNDWRSGIGDCIGIGIGIGPRGVIVLASLVGIERVVLGFALLATCLLIKHLIKVDSLIDQGLDFFCTSGNSDCLFHLEDESTVKHDTLGLIINTEGDREALKSLCISRRSCLNEAVEFVFALNS
jgi:hypothetical protein